MQKPTIYDLNASNARKIANKPKIRLARALTWDIHICFHRYVKKYEKIRCRIKYEFPIYALYSVKPN